MRVCEKRRKTAETDIELKLNLDGQGAFNISSGNGFFDHMLKLFTMHGKFDMDLKCVGDTEVDFHHSAEDIGIVLGEAVKDALCDKAGIARYADIILPMDEALILCAVDISGRSYLNYKVSLRATRISDSAMESVPMVGAFDTELVEEFFTAFVRSAGVTLHIIQLEGKNTHHIIEGIFKAFGRTLNKAVKIDDAFSKIIPSTKGSL